MTPLTATPRGVRFETDGAVGRIVLARPEAANAFDLPAARALGDAVGQAEATTVRAVSLTAEGPRFCAGGDVASFVASGDRAKYLLTLATAPPLRPSAPKRTATSKRPHHDLAHRGRARDRAPGRP